MSETVAETCPSLFPATVVQPAPDAASSSGSPALAADLPVHDPAHEVLQGVRRDSPDRADTLSMETTRDLPSSR